MRGCAQLLIILLLFTCNYIGDGQFYVEKDRCLLGDEEIYGVHRLLIHAPSKYDRVGSMMTMNVELELSAQADVQFVVDNLSYCIVVGVKRRCGYRVTESPVIQFRKLGEEQITVFVCNNGASVGCFCRNSTTVIVQSVVEKPLCMQYPGRFIVDAGVRYLIMERMKCDLVQQCSDSGGCIAASAIAAYGLQILDGLEWMHRKGFGFVDVKPQNFMLDSSGQVKFIDYGLIERLVSSAAGGVRDGTAVCAEPQGTPTFSSVAVDNGAVPSPKDDIEAMVCDCNHMI